MAATSLPVLSETSYQPVLRGSSYKEGQVAKRVKLQGRSRHKLNSGPLQRSLCIVAHALRQRSLCGSCQTAACPKICRLRDRLSRRTYSHAHAHEHAHTNTHTHSMQSKSIFVPENVSGCVCVCGVCVCVCACVCASECLELFEPVSRDENLEARTAEPVPLRFSSLADVCVGVCIRVGDVCVYAGRSGPVVASRKRRTATM